MGGAFVASGGVPTSRIHRRSNDRNEARTCELLKKNLPDNVKKLICDTPSDEPMSFFCSSDASPNRTTELMRRGDVARRQTCCRDYLVERAFVSNLRGFLPVFTDGRILKEKCMPDSLAASIELLPTVRELRFFGVVSSLYLFDRGGNQDKSLIRLFQKRHRYIYEVNDFGQMSGFENCLGFLDEGFVW